MFKKVKDSLYCKRESSAFNTALNVIITLFVIIFAFEIYFSINYTGIYVIGDSMLFTLVGSPNPEVDSDGNIVKMYSGGDYVFADKYATPDYLDIVVVSSTETKDIIKRVVAFGGDTVKMENGRLFLKKKGADSFEEVPESYLSAENNTASNIKNTFAEHVVADGCMFLLGDNRDVSSDSRANGDYSLDKLIGVVTDWSLNFKSFFTAIYTFFNFTLPEVFGIS